MPTIDNFTIPDFILDSFVETINGVDSTEIQELAKLDPTLAKGLRPSRANVKVIRQRLAARLRNNGPLDLNMRQILANSGFNLEFIAILSEQVLGLFSEDIAAAFGPAKTLGAMLVDDRAAVRAMAIELLKRVGGEPEGGGQRHAQEGLTSKLGPFLGHIAALLDREEDINVEQVLPRHGEPEKYRRQLSSMRSELKKSEKAAQRLEKVLNNKIKQKDDQLAVLKDQLAREKAGRQELKKELESLKHEMVRLERQTDTQIKKGINEEMQAVVRGWLAEPERIAKASSRLHGLKDDDLLARAGAALDAQKTVDRNYGNRRLLRTRLTELEESRNEIMRASREALNPLPELANLASDLDREIAGLQKLLGDKAPVCPWLAKLEALINQASRQTEFADIRLLLAQLESAGLLDENSRTLYGLYQQRLERFYDKYSPRAGADSRDIEPVGLIKQWLGVKDDFILVVDGYNLLFNLPEFFGLDYKEGDRPGHAARSRLLELLDRLLQGSGCRAEVFFDGEQASQENFSRQVRMHFSGGGSSEVRNRADKAIVDYLSIPLPGKAIKKIVISDDRELQGLVSKENAMVMHLSQFAAILDEFSRTASSK